MTKLIQETADHCIEEINEHIDNTIAWNLNSTTDLDGDEYYQLELKIKQQILFTLIKKVTK
tara:strand:+ start:278 stop:460 length:183 start_codon:yes stop_codon:yes gene_type:complete